MSSYPLTHRAVRAWRTQVHRLIFAGGHAILCQQEWLRLVRDFARKRWPLWGSSKSQEMDHIVLSRFRIQIESKRVRHPLKRTSKGFLSLEFTRE
ncbi:TPA: hypothetical protein DD712_01450 [Candidatus Acetothermia bacterium]|nr:hypothetical protein [Candidatus Acetothermia bacterium]